MIKAVVSTMALLVVFFVMGTMLHEEYVERVDFEKRRIAEMVPVLERLSSGEVRLLVEEAGAHWKLFRQPSESFAETVFETSDGARLGIGIDGRGVFSDLVVRRRRVLLVGLIVLLFAVEVAIFLAYSISRPVKAIAWACREVARRHWVHVPGKSARFMEFETLRKTFGEMVDELARMESVERQIDRVKRLAALGQVVAGVCHEIRNPLASMRVHLDLVSETIPEEGRSSLAFIDQELNRLNGTVTELLRFARPMKPVKGPVSVRRLFDWCRRMVEAQMREKGIEWREQLEEDLFIWGDTGQLRQMFLNLVLNSVRAMSDEGGVLELTAFEGGDWVVLEVADTGPGVPAELAESIFDPFFTTHADGTGLGLSIVHQIVQVHEGTIDLVSQDKGARFRIVLPPYVSGGDGEKGEGTKHV
jgi:signal transduction histidine kinase